MRIDALYKAKILQLRNMIMRCHLLYDGKTNDGFIQSYIDEITYNKRSTIDEKIKCFSELLENRKAEDDN